MAYFLDEEVEELLEDLRHRRIVCGLRHMVSLKQAFVPGPTFTLDINGMLEKRGVGSAGRPVQGQSLFLKFSIGEGTYLTSTDNININVRCTQKIRQRF